MRDDIRQKIRDHIDRHGQHLHRVFASKDDSGQPFMYTIGNHEHRLPELLLVGTTESSFAHLLNHLGAIQRDRDKAFEHEELISIGGRFPVRMIATGKIAREEYTVQVGVFYGTECYEVRQVLLCDTKGRWPDDPACDRPYSAQPLLSRIAE